MTIRTYIKKEHPPLEDAPEEIVMQYHWKCVTSVTIRNANNAKITHITGEISFALPSNTLRITQVRIANIMPVAMEYASGIISIAM